MYKWCFCILLLIPIAFYIGTPYTSQTIITERSDKKTIEIKGEVSQPGVYEVAWEATIAQVLHEAGGVTQKADLSSINQTHVLENGAVLIIPIKQEKTCISINTATSEQLDTLPGIGEKIAQRIILEREVAPFVQLEDIKRVKGIGDKLFEKMKSDICL